MIKPIVSEKRSQKKHPTRSLPEGRRAKRKTEGGGSQAAHEVRRARKRAGRERTARRARYHALVEDAQKEARAVAEELRTVRAEVDDIRQRSESEF